MADESEHRIELDEPLVDLTDAFFERFEGSDTPFDWLASMLSPENNPMRNRHIQSWALVKALAQLEADLNDMRARLMVLERRLDARS